MRVIAYLMRFSMHLCVNPLYVFFGFVTVQCVYVVPLKADDKNRNAVKNLALKHLCRVKHNFHIYLLTF